MSKRKQSSGDSYPRAGRSKFDCDGEQHNLGKVHLRVQISHSALWGAVGNRVRAPVAKLQHGLPLGSALAGEPPPPPQIEAECGALATGLTSTFTSTHKPRRLMIPTRWSSEIRIAS